MIEKKVYRGWAYKEDEEAKKDMNRAIYNELIDKYKCLYKDKPTQEDLNNYDFVYGNYRNNVLCDDYMVYKKPEKLTDDEAMLIIDNGNLCFGGRNYGNYSINGLKCKCYRIYTD